MTGRVNAWDRWYNWRYLPHRKDWALTPVGALFERLPIAQPSGEVEEPAERLVRLSAALQNTKTAIHDWLRIGFGIDRPGRTLEAPERPDGDSFVAAVRAALPRRRHLSAAEIARLKREHADTSAPARQAAAEVERLERGLSDLVNRAYGLTQEEVAPVWSTAPDAAGKANDGAGCRLTLHTTRAAAASEFVA